VNPEHAPKLNTGSSLVQKKAMIQAYETVKKAISNAQIVLNAALKRQAQHSGFEKKSLHVLKKTVHKVTGLTINQDRAGEYEGPTLGRAHGCKPEQVTIPSQWYSAIVGII